MNTSEQVSIICPNIWLTVDACIYPAIPAYSCQGHPHTHTHTHTSTHSHTHTHTHALNKATFRLIQRHQLSRLADVLTWNRNTSPACGAVRSLCYRLRRHGPLALNETLLLLWAYCVMPSPRCQGCSECFGSHWQSASLSLFIKPLSYF